MDARVAVALSIIEDNPQVTVKALLLRVNLSDSRLRHLFRAETGMSLSRYLRHVRVLEAERLLLTGFLSIKEVAVALGFGTPSYFVREFRKVFAVSPGAYRRSGGSRTATRCL